MNQIFRLFSDFGHWIAPVKLMAITERNNTSAPSLATISDNAPDEFARIVTVMMYKTSLDVSGWDANNEAAWEALVTAGDIFVIGPVRGMLPESTLSETQGYGFTDVRKNYYDIDVAIEHLSADASLDMWSRFSEQSGDWAVAFVFEDLSMYLYLGKDLIPIPARVCPRPFSRSEEIGDERAMKVGFKFKHKQLPYTLDVSASPGVFKLN